jgi:hypothetical protein
MSLAKKAGRADRPYVSVRKPNKVKRAQKGMIIDSEAADIKRYFPDFTVWSIVEAMGLTKTRDNYQRVWAIGAGSTYADVIPTPKEDAPYPDCLVRLHMGESEVRDVEILKQRGYNVKEVAKITGYSVKAVASVWGGLSANY